METTDALEMMRQNAGEAEAMLKLLANANRLMILCHLVKGEKPVGELVETLGISQSALSQHLAKMRAQKLVAAERRGQMIYYRIATPEVSAILATLYMIYCKTA